MPETGLFQELYQLYPANQMPFLQRAKRRAVRTRPYAGLKIAHNVPVTPETALKIEVLALGGAELTVTSPSFVAPDPAAIDLLRKAGIEVRDEIGFAGDVDVALDCGGELLSHVKPRVGAGELTGTGTARYRQARLEHPVIAVDESRVKDLEALLGTGEAFVRAFRQLVPRPIAGEAFLVFGYGKVGRGIVRALRPHTGVVAVVDVDADALAAAERAGCEAMHADETARIENWARRAFAAVTATGVKGVVSDRFDPAAFQDAHLANMGAEDEFGDGFAASDVLHDKQPVNFAVKAPTLMRYLDPVFHAHNLAVDLLLTARLEPGVHPFPSFLAEEIVDEWQCVFGEELSEELTALPL
ncbi:MAG: NAD-binding protein [Stackebrandtia sp.]